MKVGLAQLDFTPCEGYMPGEFYPYYSRGHYTTLLSNAAAFTAEDGTSVIIVSADCLNFETERAVELRQKISDATGVPASNILLAATHTHTGPSDHRKNGLCPPEVDTGIRTEKKILESAIEAWNSRSEAKLGIAKGKDDRMSFNRDCILRDGRIETCAGRAVAEDIVGYLGEVDYDVHVMRIDTPDGKVRGFIVNYANHPDNHKKRKFSGDFPAYMRNYLKEEYGEDVTVLFLNGACGDVNAYDYKNSSDKYHLEMDIPPIGIGRMLADTVIELNKKIIPLSDEQTVRAASAILTVNARIPTEAEIKESLRVKALLEACEETGREAQHIALSTLAHDYSKKTIDTEMSAVRIGPWAIVTIAGELYTEIGLRIKAVSPIEHTLISELTNGSEGYIAPDKTIGTTAYGGCYFAGRFGLGAGDVLVEGAKKLLDQLV